MGLDTAVTILLITHGRTPHQCSVNGQTGYDPTIISDNMMAWQCAETLVEIRVTLADIRGTTK